MKPMNVALILWLWVGISLGGTGAMASEPPDSTPDAAKVEREFKLPPGFKEQKRGRFTLYCKREAAMGTRLKSETCLSEAQMRDYILALETNKVDIDRVRAICSNPCVCGHQC